MDTHHTPKNSARPQSIGSQSVSIQSAALPRAIIDVKSITTVLFLVEQCSLEQALTNMLVVAAVCRAVAVASGQEPQLKVMGEVQLRNARHAMSENSFVQGLSSGDEAVLLTAASVQKSQMAHLIGMHALEGATLHGVVHLVEDDRSLGDRRQPRTPIRGLVQDMLKDSRDSHVGELLRLAAESECPESHDAVILACRGALITLQALSLPSFRTPARDRVAIFPTISAMISDWSKGDTIPQSCKPLLERHEEGQTIAQSLWAGAQEIAPGVFQLVACPPEETDNFFRRYLSRSYEADAWASYVLERGRDAPATSLSYDEALAFQRRRAVGESSEELPREVSKLMEQRRDPSSMDIALAEMRDRDPDHTLAALLKRAEYRPDPDGVRFTVLKAFSDDLYSEMVARNIPVIEHDALGVCGLAKGSARPFMISFQGQYLEEFLQMVHGLREKWE